MWYPLDREDWEYEKAYPIPQHPSADPVSLAGAARLALARKGFCHRAGRAVRANIVAAATSIVMIGGVRVGIVRRTRFGTRCEDAVETLFHALPQCV
jgi:hypothetical protein